MTIDSLYTELIAVQRQITPEAPAPKKETITIQALTEKYESIVRQIQKSPVANKPNLLQRMGAIGNQIKKIGNQPSTGSRLSQGVSYVRRALLSAASRFLPHSKEYDEIVRSRKDDLSKKVLTSTIDSLETLIDISMSKLDSTMDSLRIKKPEDVVMLVKANLLQLASNILDALNRKHTSDPRAFLRLSSQILTAIHNDITAPSEESVQPESLEQYAPQLTEKILSLAFPINQATRERQFAIPPSTLGYALKTDYVFSILIKQLETRVISPILKRLDEALKELKEAPQPSVVPTPSPVQTGPKPPSLGKKISHALNKVRKTKADTIADTLKEKETKELITTLSKQVTDILIAVIPEFRPRPLRTAIQKIVQCYVKKYGSLLILDPPSVLNAVLPILAEELSIPREAAPGATAISLSQILDAPVDKALKGLFALMRKRFRLDFSLPPRKFFSNLKWIILYQTAGCFVPWLVRQLGRGKEFKTIRVKTLGERVEITRLKKESGKYAEMVARGVLGEKVIKRGGYDGQPGEITIE